MQINFVTERKLKSVARNTKASRILNDAAMRLEAARIREQTARSQLNTAKAVLDLLQESYDALEKELAPTPRKSKAKGTTNVSAPKEPKAAKEDGPKSTDQLCIAKVPGLGVVCNDPEESSIHDPNSGYGGVHEFEAPKVKKAAAQK